MQAIADMGVILHSTLPASRAVGTKHKNILYHGHLSKIEWHELLSSSMFMLDVLTCLLLIVAWATHWWVPRR